MAAAAKTKSEWTLENAGVGQRLRYYRSKACLSMDQLCDRARVGKSTLQRYENGTITLSCAVAQSLADALGVAAWRILYGDDA